MRAKGSRVTDGGMNGDVNSVRTRSNGCENGRSLGPRKTDTVTHYYGGAVSRPKKRQGLRCSKIRLTVVVLLLAFVWCFLSVTIGIRQQSDTSNRQDGLPRERRPTVVRRDQSRENALRMSLAGLSKSSEEARDESTTQKSVPGRGADSIMASDEATSHDVGRTLPAWNPSSALHLSQNAFHPPFGFVMRDFARRVLSRHVANSNVLIVAPDAVEAHQEALQHNNKTIYDSVDFDSPYSLGGTFALHATTEGHQIHAFNVGMKRHGGEWTAWNQTLDQRWNNDMMYDDNDGKRPGWFLLAVLDPGWSWEDVVWQNATQFFEESTITYVVTAVRSRILEDGSVEMSGLEAAKTLLQHRYKLQVLQVSHYHNEHGEELSTFSQFGANALFKTVHDVMAFLKWGAESARRLSASLFTAYLFATQGLDLAIPSRRHYIDDSTRVLNWESRGQVNMYKPVSFAVCPSFPHRQWLVINFEKTDRGGGIEIFALPKEEKSMHKKVILRNVTNFGDNVPDDFTSYSVALMTKHVERVENSTLRVWYNGDIPQTSEAACAQYRNVVKCRTRILPPAKTKLTTEKAMRSTTDGTMLDEIGGKNLLVIMLDPMSRSHFRRSMPATYALVRKLNFVQFGNYTAVGDNSGPNQAALYSGKPLADRDGIAKKSDSGSPVWLWDRLHREGYVTLKGEDGCIANSNMLQSLKPNTTHGEALNEMFCFDFDRPNCLGPELAPSYLLQYASQFLLAYGSNGLTKSKRPWAAFLHFVDSHEDTMALSSSLDLLLSQFLNRTHHQGKLSDAWVVFLSDHGLHYGPYFQSISGQKERSEPLLYVATPTNMQNSTYRQTLERNADLWMTPFDVHQTMLDVTIGRDNNDESIGLSLSEKRRKERSSCRSSAMIPRRFCALHDMLQNETLRTCHRTPRPPSMLSFFADIPKTQRSSYHQNCSGLIGKRPAKLPPAFPCFTSHHRWRNCTHHPFGSNKVTSTGEKLSHFAVLQMNSTFWFETRFGPTAAKRIAPRLEKARRTMFGAKGSSAFAKADTTGASKISKPPNVLFLEIDSVSIAHADRHLPLTRQFLKNRRVQLDENGNASCLGGACSFDFTKFAIVGPNSVANQVATLSGCVVSRFHKSCFPRTNVTDKCYENGLYSAGGKCERCKKGVFPIDPLAPCNTTKGTPEKCCTSKFPALNATRICKDESLPEYGLQLFRRGPRSHTTWCPRDKHSQLTPWLFDVAKSSGYVTYFADEFCYDDSIYVTQGNVFPLHADFNIHSLYCILRKNEKYTGPDEGPNICVGHEHENPAFDQIGGLWKSYSDIPKFAYLNAIAAHDYDSAWIKMISGLESYDEQLVLFLERMTAREDFANTVIIVRADHGLQGGPTTLEYSVQVEHRDPWTEILVPEGLSGISLKTLAANQDKMATGYDLYHTLRKIMSSANEGSPPIPSWSYDLFNSVIPEDRTCRDAKVPDDFCPCDGVGPDRPPQWGVCNHYEPHLDLNCVGREERLVPEFLCVACSERPWYTST